MTVPTAIANKPFGVIINPCTLRVLWFRKSDIVLGRKGFTPMHASLKEGGDENNILTRSGIAPLSQHGFRDGNHSEVDRGLGQL